VALHPRAIKPIALIIISKITVTEGIIRAHKSLLKVIEKGMIVKILG